MYSLTSWTLVASAINRVNLISETFFCQNHFVSDNGINYSSQQARIVIKLRVYIMKTSLYSLALAYALIKSLISLLNTNWVNRTILNPLDA